MRICEYMLNNSSLARILMFSRLGNPAGSFILRMHIREYMSVEDIKDFTLRHTSNPRSGSNTQTHGGPVMPVTHPGL